MAVAQVFGCALPAQTSETRSSGFPLKHRPGACFVAISPATTSTISVKGCLSSLPPSLHVGLGSSLADFKGLPTGVVKQDMESNQKPRWNYYTKLAERLAVDGHLVEMADLLAMLADAGIDRRALMAAVEMDVVQCAIRGVLGRGYLDIFLVFLERLRAAGFDPLRFVGDSAMPLLSRQVRRMLMQGELDKCIHVLTSLSECGFAVKRFVDVRSVVTACAKFRNVEAALRYAELLPMVNLHYNFIMQEFDRHGDMGSVLAVFSSMTQAGIKPDMYSYRSLIDACAHHGEVAKAVSVFQEIVSSGAIPNVYVYNGFMNVRAEDTEVVWQLYTDMRRLGVEPDLTTYNIMLKSCNLSKSFDKAISLYKDMEISAASSGLKLDVFTYTTTIHMFGDAKLWELALQVKEDMIRSGVAPNVMTWTALMGACANVGMVDQAFSLFNEMRIAGCAPNEQTYNMLINACCKGSQHERAFQLFREWKKNGRISAYRESEQRESVSHSRASPGQIRKLYPDEKISGSRAVIRIPSGRTIRSKPNLVTYNTLMKSCGEEPMLVKEIMEEIVSAGLTPDLTSWSTYIDAFGSKGELHEAINLFENMKDEGITPDLVVYTSIIKACVKARDADKAFEYFEQLKEAGLRPNKVTYHTLFTAHRTCRKLSEVQRALALYEEMREAGYAPNDGILKILLAQWAEGAFEYGGNPDKTACFALKVQNEESAGFSDYSKVLLQKAAVHAQKPEAEPNLMIDLHGLSRGEARVAVLTVLRIIKERHNQGYRVNDDLVIITGVGRRSEVPGFPIIRQAVLHVLEKELSLPVKFGGAEVQIIRKVPSNVPSEDHVVASGLDTKHLVDTNDISDQNQSPPASSRDASGSSDTGTYTRDRSQPKDAFSIRKPTNLGRLIVSKDALEEWLSKKRSIPVTSSTQRSVAESVDG